MAVQRQLGQAHTSLHTHTEDISKPLRQLFSVDSP